MRGGPEGTAPVPSAFFRLTKHLSHSPYRLHYQSRLIHMDIVAASVGNDMSAAGGPFKKLSVESAQVSLAGLSGADPTRVGLKGGEDEIRSVRASYSD